MKQTLHFGIVAVSSVVCAVLSCLFFMYDGWFNPDSRGCIYAAWMLAAYGLLCYAATEVFHWSNSNPERLQSAIWAVRCMNLFLGAVIFRVLGWDIPMFIAFCAALMILRFFIIAIGMIMHCRR